ncbi:hypothetical protein [Streptomyces anulatus]|uniref:hypothetical protein n=1 Tax=Streptomyces anulatus TaxID=1892 RepID=UPI003652BEE0
MPNPNAEIALTTSSHLGLVAITHGEKYQQANRALEEAGFARLPNGRVHRTARRSAGSATHRESSGSLCPRTWRHHHH